MAIKIKNGSVYVPYDSITILNNPDGGGLQIQFNWKGKEMSYLNIDDARLDDNNTAVVIENIKGKQKATITAM